MHGEIGILIAYSALYFIEKQPWGKYKNKVVKQK